jgi:hypothetical protein
MSDEYGPYIYRFDSNKQITGILGLPDAVIPRRPAGTVNFDSLTAPASGRRNNQGMEGLALSPDGTKLFALLQSATVQDTNGSQQQTRNNARLMVYDLAADPVPQSPTGVFAVQLPILNNAGNGGAADRTAAQSEIVALSDSSILVLARDSNGYGVDNAPAPVVKSIFAFDIANATNLAGNGTINSSTGTIAVNGALNAGITPALGAEVLNLINASELNRFNFNLNSGASADELTFSEKWEGLSLVPALDPSHPDDYFLFVANDNDFNTLNGFMKLADGTFQQYAGNVNNDTVFLAYRVSITVPEPTAAVFGALAFAALLKRRRA